MPAAESFSPRQGNPPAFQAYGSQPGGAGPDLIGYVFTTPDLPPEEVGFSGPIDLLVGMDLEGRITGVKVLHYLESHKLIRGDFIVDSGFPEQFIGKSVSDEFRIGRDIDGMSRATISSWALARGLRNAARRVAEAYLPDVSYVVEASVESAALQSLREQSWAELMASGFVRQFSVPLASEADLQIMVAYMGHYRLGELLVGAADYSNADRTATGMVADGHMLLLGLDGSTARLQQLRLGVLQDDVLYPNGENRVVFAGTASAGKIAGQAQFAVALFIDPAVDITRPFTVVYDTGERRGEFDEYVGVDYQLTPAVLSLIGMQAQPELTWGDFTPVLLLLALLLGVLNWRRRKQAGT